MHVLTDVIKSYVYILQFEDLLLPQKNVIRVSPIIKILNNFLIYITYILSLQNLKI